MKNLKPLQLTFTVALLLLFLSVPLQAQVQLRYEGYLESGGSPVSLTNQSFQVQILKPGCASNLGLTAWSGNADIVNGEFNLPVLFSNSAAFNNAMDSTVDFGGGACGPGVDRLMRITYAGEVFDVTLQDAPRAAYSNLAQNSKSLGGVPVSTSISCSASQYMTINASGQIQCSNLSLAAGDIPAGTALAGDVTGTLGAAVVARLQTQPVSATAPTTNQVLKFNGTQWAPAADDAGAAPGDASFAAKGLVQFDTNAATSGISVTAGVASLPNTITAAGPIGSATAVPVITYDNKGRLTAVTTATVNDNTKLPLAGGTLTGAINMGTQNITNATSIAATNFSGRNVIVNDNDTNFVTLRTPSNITADYILQLPPDDGAASQVLTTDGAGLLSWSTPSGGIAVTPNQAVVANGTGTGLSSFTCALNQVMGFNVSGLPQCQTVTPAGGLLQDGNSFAAAITFGTNDNFDLNVETNNTTRMTFKNTGFVGIGTTNPSAPLHVTANLIGEPLIVQNTNVTGWSSTKYYDNTGGFTGSIGYGNTGASTFNDKFYIETNNKDFLLSTGSERLRVNASNGYLGLNTTNPGSRLDINGDLNFREMAAPAVSASDQGRIYFDATTNKFRVSENGGAFVDLVGAAGAATSVLAIPGSNASPSISFSGDPDTGLYSPAANTLGITAGGANTFNFTSTGMNSPTTGGASVGTAAGTITTPTYSFAGDAGTGWWRPAANTIAASVGTLEKFRITPTGSVGIGTTAPTQDLVVYKPNANGAAMTVASPGTGASQQSVINLMTSAPTNTTMGSGSNKGWQIYANSNSYTDIIGGQNDLGIAFYGGVGPGWSNDVLYFDTVNAPLVNVGINTNSPATQLHVEGTLKIADGGESCATSGDGGMIRYAGTLLQYCNGTTWQTLGSGGGFAQPGITAATAPGYNFVGSTTSGMYWDGGYLGLTTNGQPRLSISNSLGQVGIGTTTPAYSLDVISNAGTPYMSMSTTGGSFGPGLRLNHQGGGGRDFRILSTGSSESSGSGNLEFFDQTASQSRMIIDFNGNVGIGTTFPTDRLEVNGTTRAQRFISSSSSFPTAPAFHSAMEFQTGMYFPASGNIGFSTFGSERMLIDNTGRVGIGISTPQARLDLGGDLLMQGMTSPGAAPSNSGKIYFDDTLDEFRVSQNGSGWRSLIPTYTANRILATNGTGQPIDMNCGLGMTISFDGAGMFNCVNFTGPGGFINGGNSYGSSANLGTNDNQPLYFRTNGATHLALLPSSGFFGIGTISPDSPLHTNAFHIGNANFAAAKSILNAQPTAAHTGQYNAHLSELMLTGTNSINEGVANKVTLIRNTTGTAGTLIGSDVYSTSSSPGTTNQLVGSRNIAQLDSGTSNSVVGSISEARLFGASSNTSSLIGSKTLASVTSGGNTTNAIAQDISVLAAGGTITSGIGLNIGTIAGTTSNFAIYQSDSTAENFFSGRVGIGTTNPSQLFTIESNGVTSGSIATYPFRVNNSTSGTALSIGVSANFSEIQTSPTSQPLTINPNGGNVVIGTLDNSYTNAKLRVNGQIVGTDTTVASGSTVNFVNGNTVVLTAPGGPTLTLQNMYGGGKYTVIINDVTQRTYTFGGCATSYFSPANGNTTVASRTVYNITYTSSGVCYIDWKSGYQ